jgi:hypothetical protein
MKWKRLGVRDSRPENKFVSAILTRIRITKESQNAFQLISGAI